MPDTLTAPELVPAEDDLVVAVEALGEAHDRHGAERSDPTGTSAGDDDENRDSSP